MCKNRFATFHIIKRRWPKKICVISELLNFPTSVFYCISPKCECATKYDFFCLCLVQKYLVRDDLLSCICVAAHGKVFCKPGSLNLYSG